MSHITKYTDKQSKCRFYISVSTEYTQIHMNCCKREQNWVLLSQWQQSPKVCRLFVYCGLCGGLYYWSRLLWIVGWTLSVSFCCCCCCCFAVKLLICQNHELFSSYHLLVKIDNVLLSGQQIIQNNWMISCIRAYFTPTYTLFPPKAHAHWITTML